MFAATVVFCAALHQNLVPTATRPADSRPATQPAYGAAEANELGSIGGGAGYRRIVTHGDFTVGNLDQLVDALRRAKPGQVVYVQDKAEIDLTVRGIAYKQFLDVPAGVTLASGRGYQGSAGALIFTEAFGPNLIEIVGKGVRITGLRLEGPDKRTRQSEIAHLIKRGLAESRGSKASGDYYLFPASSGIVCTGAELEVDNCEIWGWGSAGVNLFPGAAGARIHHNSIHHCQRQGLGYGVCISKCDALIEFNRLDFCRHAIAATGLPGTAYEARHNVVGPTTSSAFDMHGSKENGMLVDGVSIAGEWIRIHHNTFNSKEAAVGIRGLPRQVCEVHHNWFSAGANPIWQVGGRGNMKVHDNVRGPQQAKWEYAGQ